MTENIQTNRKFNKIFTHPIALFWYYVVVNMVPSVYFGFTQPIDSLGKLVIILFPLGLFMTILSIFKNVGIGLWICFPFIFLHAFQIVLFYLYGQDIIASDMFLNVVTTNTSEVNELLGSLLLSIGLVCVLYIPVLILASLQWKRKNCLSWSFRKQMLFSSIPLLVISFSLSFLSKNNQTNTFAFKDDVYPVNVLNNLNFAYQKWNKIKRYPETSKNFTFKAHRDQVPGKERQIYVLIIGETGRADSWSLYGYDRLTNPNLMSEKNLVVFKDALTQSNTTHKSVSIILSDVDAKHYHKIYQRKGIMQAFREAGFKTICLSNQTENGSFIEYFTKEADIYKTIRTRNPKTHLLEHSFDEELVALMQEEIEKNTGDLFIVLHTYGSHFNYTDRYPEKFSKFKPDRLYEVRRSMKDRLVNAYDNTILYTDYFLSEAIKVLKKSRAEVAMLYVADHGEDLFDDDRNKFLHASPTPTYYQLRIPFVMWFSDPYMLANKNETNAAEWNSSKPISTNAVFHTMLDAAHIKTPYLAKNLSLVDSAFQVEDRMYLNDHDLAVPYIKMNLKTEDFDMLKKNSIKN